MTKNDLTYLLAHPHQITPEQTTELEKVLQNFPFFQSVRVLYLKGLFNQNNFNYNKELKITAAYTTNRTLLFHFITSNFLQNISAESVSENKENNTFVTETKIETIAPVIPDSEPLERSIKKLINQVDNHANSFIINWGEEVEKVEINSTPKKIEPTSNTDSDQLVAFNTNESHSFSQWLQLTKMKPIEREDIEKPKPEASIEEDSKTTKFELIDKFIEANPKIGTVKQAIAPVNVEKSNQENSRLMTETLAKIYLDQKKYQKAIQAYEILILKYPEKSSLFAERITEIKKIQNNNN
ncbi:hypothetical protein K5I29_08635 [Flavobacterium agricola]|uniref:Tetratricopeptide repeat protein n=1 Tax=Flavobacterium agricola TaxID=2870839 RepID=A0ABY6LW96_9FLAO|nr:tetratricopeptide repeat protein [Flavobacterium agricola]UYW00605.1 hypothetical protein K5I29_08635 [Flavobacterium agricola]